MKSYEWISAEHELPEIYKVSGFSKVSAPVLVCNDGSLVVARLLDGNANGMKGLFWIAEDSDCNLLYDVTHWMQIHLPEKET